MRARRTLASWFWHDYYGERRNEIVLTGVDLDEHAIRVALDEVLLTDHELAQGRGAWAAAPDPLLGLRLSPDAVALAVSVHGRNEERPSVQRFPSGDDPRIESIAPNAATGSPAVILRQDLLSLRRTVGSGHVILALPGNLDILPFLVELWRTRSGATSLGDHYAAAPVLVAVDPAPFMAEIGCVHQAVRLWNGWDRTAPLTQAEAAARQTTPG
ncbi:hypothetical protein [Streptomyces sp. NPDC002133]|uniref:hypothetical protein n=1 Tax=Streptomyces sp. NPDC002133 TaxID=3154409 RepID=UPI003318A42A